MGSVSNPTPITKAGLEKVVDLSGTPADGSVTLLKLAAATLTALFKPWRSRMTVGGSATTSAAAATKYFCLNNVSDQNKPAGNAAVMAIPWRIGWVAADEAIEGLTTKCKITAAAGVKTASKVTVHVGLYKVTKGAEFTLGEEIGAGVNLELGENTNTEIAGESAEFTIPEDTDYALGYTVSGTPAAGFAVQARLKVHNV